jgi:hypothetical protein
MSKPEPEPQPKRGAPPGNKNALKHGFYSRALTEQEQRDSSAASGRFRDEINLLKVLVYRIALSLKTPEGGEPVLSFREYLETLQALSMAISRLYRFYYIEYKLTPPSDSKSADAKSAYLKPPDTKSDVLAMIPVLAQMTHRTDEQVEKELEEYRKSLGDGLGDANARKHGFYSSAFKPDELRRLDLADQSEIVDEITLLGTLNKRLLISMGNVSKLERLDQLRALRVITFSCICIERLENLLIHVFDIPFSEDEFLRRKILEAMRAFADARHLGDRFDETKRKLHSTK